MGGYLGPPGKRHADSRGDILSNQQRVPRTPDSGPIVSVGSGVNTYISKYVGECICTLGLDEIQMFEDQIIKIN